MLDEPTNHLDIETIEALGKAINKFTVLIFYLFVLKVSIFINVYFFFKGGVILVSHDERLIRMICKELWVCGNGTVKSVDGGFDEYRKIVEAEIEAAKN